MVKTVIKKCGKLGTTMALLRSKCSSKTESKDKRVAPKRSTATLKELQKVLTSSARLLHVKTRRKKKSRHS